MSIDVSPVKYSDSDTSLRRLGRSRQVRVHLYTPGLQDEGIQVTILNYRRVL